MTQAETALTKYVFLDIVAFTKGRSVEAQSDLVAELNSIVRSGLKNRKLKSSRRIQSYCPLETEFALPYSKQSRMTSIFTLP